MRHAGRSDTAPEVPGNGENDESKTAAAPPTPSFGKMLQVVNALCSHVRGMAADSHSAQLAGPELPLLCLTLVSRIAAEGTGLLIPYLTAAAFDAVVEELKGGDKSSSRVARVMITVLILHTLSAFVLPLFNMAITGWAGERVVARLRARLFGHILSQELGYFDTHKSGELVSRLGSDTQLVQQACSQHLIETLNGLLKVFACFAFMFVISWRMTLMILGAAAALGLVICPFGAYIGVLTRRYQDALGQAASCSTEAIGAMRTVRAFAGEAIEFRREPCQLSR